VHLIIIYCVTNAACGYKKQMHTHERGKEIMPVTTFFVEVIFRKFKKVRKSSGYNMQNMVYHALSNE